MPDEPKRRDGAGIGEVVRELLGGGVWRRGIALGRLARGWDVVVGDKLATVCRPLSLEDGKLLIGAATAAWAAQLGFLEREVAQKANELLKRPEVRSVRVIVERPR
jgi:predicted nucleic acid-binding Zn ribbon protein